MQFFAWPKLFAFFARGWRTPCAPAAREATGRVARGRRGGASRGGRAALAAGGVGRTGSAWQTLRRDRVERWRRIGGGASAEAERTIAVYHANRVAESRPAARSDFDPVPHPRGPHAPPPAHLCRALGHSRESAAVLARADGFVEGVSPPVLGTWERLSRVTANVGTPPRRRRRPLVLAPRRWPCGPRRSRAVPRPRGVRRDPHRRGRGGRRLRACACATRHGLVQRPACVLIDDLPVKPGDSPSELLAARPAASGAHFREAEVDRYSVHHSSEGRGRN